MAKTLNFNNAKKQYFTVTMPDKKKTTLMICTPTKAIFNEFSVLSETVYDDVNQDQAINDLYEICAKIMNRNKGGIKVTVEQLEEILDFEDVIVFIKGYSEFVREVTNQKN